MLNNIYQNKESFLNYFGLNAKKSSEDNNLTSIYDLDIDYFSVGMTTMPPDHIVSNTIDLNKIKYDKDNIYMYDSSRFIDFYKTKGDLGGIQKNTQVFSHSQQELGSCWYHTIASILTILECPEIIEKIRSGKIKPITSGRDFFITDNTDLNDFEVLQILKLQEIAEDLGVGRFGCKSEKQEFTRKGNRPRMIHHITNKDTKKIIKKVAKKYMLRN